jgi:Clp amino terminal domain, pathogenicity island component
MAEDDMTSAYLLVLQRACLVAGETGELCRPAHLLAALAETAGPVSDALRPPGGGPLFQRGADPPPVHGGGCGYLVMQIQEGARELASDRGEAAGPEHLFLAVIDQSEPEAAALLAAAGLDIGALRSAALRILGAPPDMPAIRMPPLTPAGTLDRPALALEDLNPRAWQVMCWRQEHLPLRRLRRRSHYQALWHLESRAAWRVASRLGLDDDQCYSISHHHLEQVERLAAQAKPGLIQPRHGWPRHPIAMPVSVVHYRRRLSFALGWGTWFSNRWVGLRDRWFQFRTIPDYRGLPNP